MKIQILTIDSELTSAKSLGYPTFLYPEEVKIYSAPVVRWGNSFEFCERGCTDNYDFSRVYNPRAAIRLNCDKFTSKQKIATVAKIPTLYLERVPDKKLYVVRETHHSCGKGFVVKRGPFNLDYDSYAAEFIETDTEYRVWFALGKTLGAYRVRLNSNKITKYPCRSGWGYSYCSISKELSNSVVKAAEVIGLDFGAADVLYANNEYYFLELNSAPSVDHPVVRQFFQKEINKIK